MTQRHLTVNNQSLVVSVKHDARFSSGFFLSPRSINDDCLSILERVVQLSCLPFSSSLYLKTRSLCLSVPLDDCFYLCIACPLSEMLSFLCSISYSHAYAFDAVDWQESQSPLVSKCAFVTIHHHKSNPWLYWDWHKVSSEVSQGHRGHRGHKALGKYYSSQMPPLFMIIGWNT